MLMSIHYNFFASILIEIISTLFLIISEGIWEPQDPSLSFIRQGTVSSPLLSFPLHSSPILSYPILSLLFSTLLFFSHSSCDRVLRASPLPYFHHLTSPIQTYLLLFISYFKAVTEYCVLPIGSEDIHSALDPDKSIKSILFYGPSGTGKTLAVEAVTHELGGLLIHLTPGDGDIEFLPFHSLPSSFFYIIYSSLLCFVHHSVSHLILSLSYFLIHFFLILLL